MDNTDMDMEESKMSTNWVGYTGGLHVIEDIYNTVLSSYQ